MVFMWILSDVIVYQRAMISRNEFDRYMLAEVSWRNLDWSQNTNEWNI